ncbi:bifunctional tetrahydrofolate synthase/dihydrofolate synthase [Paraglaciecola aquimarina]|uniref:Dihydrofolate synthase/folylpolyglutamate synthase n=1 Tax=Paraglaciecola aquimarina TaxID=1235557 RepID=A0ABU3SXS4_9ALTE|nr:bifunctional tetrahydrofolate synthase/dihydrofolate synthase [Paraglaciecola aquimarina]MDU0354798.1 bifunctional tetrahydrofolate synthase/dihydrofolate synthase [Paraglaciecola aquimarina]
MTPSTSLSDAALLSTQASDKEAWDLQQWLIYLNEIHPSNIELGLERVSTVFNKLALNYADKTVVTVAGTNGKGTTSALIEQGLLVAHKSVGVFSSPHLIDYRERVRINGAMLPESAHCSAFLKVDQARGDVLLTYFEFGTLAALQLMFDAGVDYWLLEVGLGGRLDAVNIVDPDIAVITSIDLDHQDWLGHTKELIAKEKAGIFRSNIPAVIGEPEPPQSLKQAVVDYQVDARWQGVNFSYWVDEQGYHWQGEQRKFSGLPVPFIPLQNVSTALEVIELLALELTAESLKAVIQQTKLVGRRQIIQDKPMIMLDVAHNPQATRLLAADLRQENCKRILAVVGMLADKDIEQTLKPMQDIVDDWFCADLDVPRGAKASVLLSALQQSTVTYRNVQQAFLAAIKEARPEDCVIVFGSFFTIADILNYTSNHLISEEL